MGWLDDAIEAVIETPGRVPEIGVKAFSGTIEGIEKGVKKVEKSLDKHSY